MGISFTDYLNVPVVLTCMLIGYLIKNYTQINNKRIPLLMLIIGAITDVIITHQNGASVMFYTFIEGAVAGLASCGLYDLFTKSIGIKKNTGTDDIPVE